MGYVGDVLVIGSSLSGPFAPVIASSGTAISTVAAVGEAAVDVNKGDVGKVVTPVF